MSVCVTVCVCMCSWFSRELFSIQYIYIYIYINTFIKKNIIAKNQKVLNKGSSSKTKPAKWLLHNHQFHASLVEVTEKLRSSYEDIANIANSILLHQKPAWNEYLSGRCVIGLLWFYGIPTIQDYLMLNPLYAYIY